MFALSMLAWIALPALASAKPRHEEDRGESPQNRALTRRSMAPRKSDLDGRINLQAMLRGRNASAFSTKKAATVEGYVQQCEVEFDGDVHLVLATNHEETNTRSWIIVEVTPSWQKKKSSLASSRLRHLVGKRVRATGWLYYEPDEESRDPRGTRWELHPVTDIEILQ
jgi:hypothetical protein